MSLIDVQSRRTEQTCAVEGRYWKGLRLGVGEATDMIDEFSAM
jgi:hypothetical protein